MHVNTVAASSVYKIGMSVTQGARSPLSHFSTVCSGHAYQCSMLVRIRFGTICLHVLGCLITS